MKVRGIEIDDKVYAKISKKLIELSEGWEKGLGNGHISKGFGTNLKGHRTISDVPYCHAWLPRNWDNSEPYIIANCHSKRRSEGICKPEAHEAMIMWIAKETPFSEYFLNRDDDHSLANGGAILLGGKEGLTRNELMWVCKALRYCVESGQAGDVWYELYKAGINPMLALLVATDVRSIKGAAFGYTGKLAHNSVFGNNYDADIGHYNVAELLNPVLNRAADNTGAVFFSKKIYPKKRELPFKKFCAPKKRADGWGGEVAIEAANKDDFIARVRDWEAELRGMPVGKAPDKTTVFSEIDI